MEVKRGVVKTFDATTYKATVQISESSPSWLARVRVSRDIPSGEMVVRRRYAVIFFSASNPDDAVLAAVYV